MKKIKVLHIITDSNIGGAGKYIILYCQNRNAKKFEIVVGMPKGSLLKPEVEATRCACN